MSAVSGESLRRPQGRPPSSTDLHFPFLEQRLQGGRLVLLLRGLEELRDPGVDVLDLFRDLVLIRLEALELFEAFHRSLEFAEQLVFRAQRQGRGLLPHLHLGDAPLQRTQLRADIGGAGAAGLPFHLDQGLRLPPALVPLLPVPPGFSAEPRATVLEGPELCTDLPLLLVDEIPLLPEELRLLVQGVALLEETLELNLRLIEFRKGFLPDHRVPRGKMECSD